MSFSAPSPGTAPIGRRGEIALAVALAVDAVPSVTRSKSLIAATMYPGGWVEGVALSKDQVAVQIVVDDAEYGRSLMAIGNQVHRAVRRILTSVGDQRGVEVRIDDFAAIHAPSESQLG